MSETSRNSEWTYKEGGGDRADGGPRADGGLRTDGGLRAESTEDSKRKRNFKAQAFNNESWPFVLILHTILSFF